MTSTWDDQTGFSLEVVSNPRRIISLVPSQTELLYSLGLGDRVVGITKFCVHPEDWFRTKSKVGGTKKIHHELIHSLQPDLILANKEENQQEDIVELRKHFPVYTTDIRTIRDAFEMIETVGALVNKQPEALAISFRLRQDFTLLQLESELVTPKKVIYLIWENPRMGAGNETFIHNMLQLAGLENLLSGRYPVITDAFLKELYPEIVLLSSEPFPYKEKHLELYRKIWPQAKIELVDGEMLSWYGSRMLLAAPYLRQLKAKFE